MASNRWDETWHRLLEWTNSSGQAERLAAQVMAHEGYADINPSHPLGGKDGGRDISGRKDDKSAVIAVYFPRGQQSLNEIKAKFESDLARARDHAPKIFVFLTNQELRLAQRNELGELATSEDLELLHLERLTAILDKPEMAAVRKQFLAIETEPPASLNLGGQGGQAPGAGGGGGGAIGEGAVAGEGGGGGQIVTATFSADDLPEVLQIIVGRGGLGGENGGDGHDGEDSEIVDLIKATGGRAGKGERTKRARGPQQVRLVGLYLADAYHVREGLLSVLGAGWERVIVQELPAVSDWCAVVSLDIGGMLADDDVRLKVEVISPTGETVLEQELELTADGRPISLRHVGVPLRVPISKVGFWKIHLLSEGRLIGCQPIEVLHNSRSASTWSRSS